MILFPQRSPGRPRRRHDARPSWSKPSTARPSGGVGRPFGACRGRGACRRSPAT